jgi:hypothetical protein
VPSADVANSTLLRISTDFFLCWGWPADDLFHTLIKIVDFKRAAKKERSQEVKKPRITVRVI